MRTPRILFMLAAGVVKDVFFAVPLLGFTFNMYRYLAPPLEMWLALFAGLPGLFMLLSGSADIILAAAHASGRQILPKLQHAKRRSFWLAALIMSVLCAALVPAAHGPEAAFKAFADWHYYAGRLTHGILGELLAFTADNSLVMLLALIAAVCAVFLPGAAKLAEKHGNRLKLWMYPAAVCAAAAMTVIMNVFIDPYGVFNTGDSSPGNYAMRLNPAVFKLEYLKHNKASYNSYVLGGEKASGLDPELLNLYYGDGARFYNMFSGGGVKNAERTLSYLAENMETRHIVLALGLDELLPEGKTSEQHPDISDESKLWFYARRLFAPPDRAAQKLLTDAVSALSPWPVTNPEYVPESGVFARDARSAMEEGLINVGEYVNQAGGGSFHGGMPKNEGLSYANYDPLLSSIRRMKENCGARGISFEVVVLPNYFTELNSYDTAVVKDYWQGLAGITDYWNFSGYHNLSGDPRGYYNSTHLRDGMGELVIGKMFGAGYAMALPEEFGVYITAGESGPQIDRLLTWKDNGVWYGIKSGLPRREIPILMYHHFVPDGGQTDTTTVERSVFSAHMTALADAGYTALALDDLRGYVKGGRGLPEKPVLITMDDGYRSNFEIAYPILKELGMKATVAVVGSALNEGAMLGFDEAREMLDSGVMDIQSHTWDMHSDGLSPPYRYGAAMRDWESVTEYASALRDDHGLQSARMERELGEIPSALFYPYGAGSWQGERILRELGYDVTVQTGGRFSAVTQGDPLSLYGLCRVNITNDITSEQLLELVGGALFAE